MAVSTQVLQKANVVIKNVTLPVVNLVIPPTVAEDLVTGVAMNGGTVQQFTRINYDTEPPGVTFDMYFTGDVVEKAEGLLNDPDNGAFSATIMFNESNTLLIYIMDTCRFSQPSGYKTSGDGLASYKLGGNIRLVVNNHQT